MGAFEGDFADQAAHVRTLADHTSWWDVHGYSSRLGREQPLGGLVGEITLESTHLRPLLPLLLWGEIVQAGKNVVKGEGIYQVQAT